MARGSASTQSNADGFEARADDLLVRARLHVRPVRDGDDGAGRRRSSRLPPGPDDGVDEGGQRRLVADAAGLGEGAEERQVREHLRHAVAVAEARGGVAVDLDEPRPVRAQEGVQPREQHVRRSGVDAHPARLRLRRAQERAQARPRPRRRRGAPRGPRSPAAAVPPSRSESQSAWATKCGRRNVRMGAPSNVIPARRKASSSHCGLLAGRPRVGLDESVVIGGGIGHGGAASGRASRPHVRPRS